MIARSVPEIEWGYPERDGEEEEGLVLEYSRKWIVMSHFGQILASNIWHSMHCNESCLG